MQHQHKIHFANTKSIFYHILFDNEISVWENFQNGIDIFLSLSVTEYQVGHDNFVIIYFATE